MGVTSRGLFGFLARLRPPPAADSDADLLARFVRTADPAAFSEIVRRHGPMVLSVCRRRLGRDADSEDAFQAVFLALARSAASVGRREALPGWLYRVAHLVALKAAGRRARRPLAALPDAEVPMPDPPPPAWETEELKSAIGSEVAALPDRFRSVVVLCLVEGRTNAEAAAALGVPVGTVDSRLSTARKKLQERLTRRGYILAASVTLEQMLGGPVSAAGPRFLELASITVRSVLAEAAGPGAGAVSPAVADLARGVTMTTNLRLLAAVGLALGLVGGVGAGIYFANAADPPAKPTVKLPEQKQPAEEARPTPATTKPVEETAPTAGLADPGAALSQPLGEDFPADGISLGELLHFIEDRAELVIRVDVAAFRRVGAFGLVGDGEIPANHVLKAIYDSKPVLPRKVGKLPLRDVLSDALAQVPIDFPCTYQVRGSQIVIVPAYQPPVKPGGNPLAPPTGPDDTDIPLLAPKVLHEQIYGGMVTVTADRRPLADVLTDLRKQTGANIVLDPRCDAQQKKATISVSLSDVRLYDALRVIADMSELKMVYAGNIYYVTTPLNAAQFQPPAGKSPVTGP